MVKKQNMDMYKQYTDEETVNRIRTILSNIISIEGYLRDLVPNLRDTHTGHLIAKSCILKGRDSIRRPELQKLEVGLIHSQQEVNRMRDEKTKDQVNRILEQATDDIHEILDQDSDIPA